MSDMQPTGWEPLPYRCICIYTELFLNERKKKGEKKRGNWMSNNERQRMIPDSWDYLLPLKFQAITQEETKAKPNQYIPLAKDELRVWVD